MQLALAAGDPPGIETDLKHLRLLQLCQRRIVVSPSPPEPGLAAGSLANVIPVTQRLSPPHPFTGPAERSESRRSSAAWGRAIRRKREVR
jgi:hypothetical protein